MVRGSERLGCGFENLRPFSVEAIQTLEDERSNPIETDDETLIQLSSVPRDFSINMALILPTTFMVNEGQSLVMCGDVEEKETPTGVMIEKDEPSRTPSPKLELDKYLNEVIEKKTEMVEHSNYQSKVTILR